MRNQLELLRDTPWDVLIVLDSLRADEAREFLPEVETVRSPAPLTCLWLRRFVKEWGRKELLLVNANPVVNRELVRHDTLWSQVPCWLWDWQPTDDGLPTVPAAALTSRLWRLLLRYGRPRRMIVWVLQPHVPYPGLPYSDWGGGMTDPLSQAIAKVPTIRQALAKGLTTWDAVLAARRHNVTIALDAAKKIHEMVGGTAILTSDHGELLGEAGARGEKLFGHHGSMGAHPLLRQVPWLVARGKPFEPCDIPSFPSRWKDDDIERKLQALGYV